MAPGAGRHRLRSLSPEMDLLRLDDRGAVGKRDVRGADCVRRHGGLLPLDRAVVHGQRQLLVLAAAAVMLVLIALALAQGVAPFATVAKGAMSNIEEPRQVVVRTEAEWQALWKQHDGNNAAPT